MILSRASSNADILAVLNNVADAVAADLAHGLLSGDSRGSLLLDEL